MSCNLKLLSFSIHSTKTRGRVNAKINAKAQVRVVVTVFFRVRPAKSEYGP